MQRFRTKPHYLFAEGGRIDLPQAALPSEVPPASGMIGIEAGGAIIRVPLNTDAARVAYLARALLAQ